MVRQVQLSRYLDLARDYTALMDRLITLESRLRMLEPLPPPYPTKSRRRPS